jgi:hypothetical protein
LWPAIVRGVRRGDGSQLLNGGHRGVEWTAVGPKEVATKSILGNDA